MPEGKKAVLIEKETPGVAVSFGFPIELRRGDPDWVALWLARSYFGEHRSTNSHLYQRIRESRGMNYGDYAYIEYFPRGMFQFNPDTNLARQQQICNLGRFDELARRVLAAHGQHPPVAVDVLVAPVGTALVGTIIAQVRANETALPEHDLGTVRRDSWQHVEQHIP